MPGKSSPLWIFNPQGLHSVELTFKTKKKAGQDGICLLSSLHWGGEEEDHDFKTRRNKGRAEGSLFVVDLS